MALWAGVPFLRTHAGPGWPLCAQRGSCIGSFSLSATRYPNGHSSSSAEQWTYSYDQLSRLLGGSAVPQRWIGQAGIGFKDAVCERDVAIYGFALLAGLVFGLVRRRLKPLSLRAFGLLILPMAIDGVGQLVGLWTSTPESGLAHRWPFRHRLCLVGFTLCGAWHGRGAPRDRKDIARASVTESEGITWNRKVSRWWPL